MDYRYVYGPDLERDYMNPLYVDDFEDSIYRINKGKDREAIKDAVYRITHIENGSLEKKNQVFTNYLQNGVDVSYFKDGVSQTKGY